jgi:osmotically-inducible protein OsmY
MSDFNSSVRVIFFTSIFLLCSGCMPLIFTGATKSAIEFAKDRPSCDTMKDLKLCTKIKTELIRKNFRDLITRVNIDVVEGRVFLTGVLRREEDALNIVEIVWRQNGVAEVINEMRVDEKEGGNFNLVQYTRDTMITGQIKSRIFMNRDIKFVNYTIITVSDIVYIFGIARSESELRNVASIASGINGVKEVVSHVVVNNAAREMRARHESKSLIEESQESITYPED